jgi:undecaprenyl-diphosphatase
MMISFHWWQALILAIVEGITEFLPVSSTGHMILASSAMGIASDPVVKLFTVAIQFGAILSVVVLYFKRFIHFQDKGFYIRIFIAFLPAVVAGFLLKKQIDALLENPLVVAISLFVGGVVLLFVDRWFSHAEEEKDRPVSFLNALFTGCFQVLAMIPGVSRSAATIVGGMACGMTRKQAAEFSFFLAVPTMLGATCKSLLDTYQETPDLLNADNLGLLILGNAVAFVVALLAIKGFISWLTKHGFYWFGWYRIGLGALLLTLYFLGIELQIID